MAEESKKVWYDAEGDFLEVIFDQEEGYYRETEDDRVMKKVDMQGHLLGFSILKVSSLKEIPFHVALK